MLPTPFPLKAAVIAVVFTAFILGLLLGIFLGSYKNSKLVDRLKPIQLAGLFVLIPYMFLMSTHDVTMTIGIFSLITGEKIGEKVGNVLSQAGKKGK
ncbi:hypothetical protein KC976_04485 [Candidatus Saccharibacteria bacterium]|nr:hypothetical protein [Candidatus Saccharibacteria bacterium]